MLLRYRTINTLLIITSISFFEFSCSNRSNKKGNDQNIVVNPKVEKNCFGVVNGCRTNDYPAVVRLASENNEKDNFMICTGTFISNNALITAAHCVKNDEGILYYVPGETYTENVIPANAIKSIKLISIDNVPLPQGEVQEARDVVIAIFPDGTAPAYLNLSSTPPVLGDKATIVGYGLTNYPEDVVDYDNYDASKHIGKTEIIEGEELDEITTGGFNRTQMKEAGINKSINNSGDSGGPLIVNGLIQGILSTGHELYKDHNDGDMGWTYYNVFADVANEYVANLILLANQNGANINKE